MRAIQGTLKNVQREQTGRFRGDFEDIHWPVCVDSLQNGAPEKLQHNGVVVRIATVFTQVATVLSESLISDRHGTGRITERIKAGQVL